MKLLQFVFDDDGLRITKQWAGICSAGFLGTIGDGIRIFSCDFPEFIPDLGNLFLHGSDSSVGIESYDRDVYNSRQFKKIHNTLEILSRIQVVDGPRGLKFAVIGDSVIIHSKRAGLVRPFFPTTLYDDFDDWHDFQTRSGHGVVIPKSNFRDLNKLELMETIDISFYKEKRIVL